MIDGGLTSDAGTTIVTIKQVLYCIARGTPQIIAGRPVSKTQADFTGFESRNRTDVSADRS